MGEIKHLNVLYNVKYLVPNLYNNVPLFFFDSTTFKSLGQKKEHFFVFWKNSRQEKMALGILQHLTIFF